MFISVAKKIWTEFTQGGYEVCSIFMNGKIQTKTAAYKQTCYGIGLTREY